MRNGNFRLRQEVVPLNAHYNFLIFQQCNDEIKNQMPPTPSEAEVSKYTSQFERCAIKCEFVFFLNYEILK